MTDRTIWTHGCDACDADEPVEYVAPLGYLCEQCRTEPERRREIERVVLGEAQS